MHFIITILSAVCVGPSTFQLHDHLKHLISKKSCKSFVLRNKVLAPVVQKMDRAYSPDKSLSSR